MIAIKTDQGNQKEGMLTYRSVSMCSLRCLIECITYDNEFTFTKTINTLKTVFGVQNVSVSDTLRCIHVHGPVWDRTVG